MRELKTKELKKLIRKTKNQIELMKVLNSIPGFSKIYLTKLSKFKNKIDAFNFVNDLHFEFFNVYKFKTYKEFELLLEQKSKD